jgi:DNA end-binding protein Ku
MAQRTPRSIWNGTIAFGLVSVPVKLYSATESKTVHFKEVHEADGAGIEHRRFCSKEDKEVPYEEVVKGFEVAAGEYVVVDKEEIAAAAGPRSRIIDVEGFVDAGEIDPVFYERAYYAGPGKDGEDAYRLLHDALERTGRAGLGRFVFHNREYLVAIRTVGNVLAVHTMRFADELVDPGDVDYEAPDRAPSKQEIEMAERLLDSLARDFDPSDYKDEHRKAVLSLIERKAKGEKIEPPEEEVPEQPEDLVAALEASLGASPKRKPARKPARGAKSRKKAKA